LISEWENQEFLGQKAQGLFGDRRGGVGGGGGEGGGRVWEVVAVVMI
jgi:hypothetical protein